MSGQGSKFSSGKFAKAISDRDGTKYPYGDMVVEPDTKLLVHPDECDEPDPYRRLRSRQDALALRRPRPETNISDADADLDGICLSQTAAGAGALTLNGALVSGGIATLDASGMPRNVVITSAGDDRSIVFTVTGTILPNVTLTERVTGANAGAATTANCFLTVTAISTSGATASTITAGIDIVGSEFDDADFF